MTNFVFPDPIETEAWESAALGLANGVTKGNWTSDDIGRALMQGTNQSFTECTANAPIEAFLMSVEPFTVNDGESFGSVKREGRIQAKAGGAIALNGLVVAGTAPARGTTDTLAVVIAGAPTNAFWRYIRLVKTAAGVVAQTGAAASAAAAAGDTILLERI